MKTLKYLGIILMAICLAAGFTACSNDDDDNINGSGNNGSTIKTENSVTLEISGTLSLVLGDKVQTITSLKITGPLNGDDIICLRQMLRCTDEEADKWGMLTVLDISDASIVSGGNKYYRDSYSTSNNEIGRYMFCNCENLEKIALPNRVTTIDYYAFFNCTNMVCVTLSRNLITIGESAFAGCYNLSEINIGNSVTTIGDYAFEVCRALTEVTIPSSVSTIGDYAFVDCVELKRFEVDEDNLVFCAKDGVLYSKDMTTLVLFPLASPLLPSFEIPNSVTTIGNNAFNGCSQLTHVGIPNSVTSIGSRVFLRCTGLTEVTIPNSVTLIGTSAFRGCMGLTQVTIGERVTSIGSFAFVDCTGLTSITSLNPTPPTCRKSGQYHEYGVFYNVPTNTCALYVSEGSKEAYSNASEWSYFKNVVEIK